ncbi:MAG: biotin carboxylase N-terminal domain-containing protein [Thermofilaceae archaeon]
MDAPFSKILIANRGEVAVRIARTAKALGIKTVTIYSDADSNALHTLVADEAYRIGGSEPTENYLNIEAIVQVAKLSSAEAVHPGYGFLSQRADFIERLEEEGVIFIGPSAHTQRLVGDKLGARNFFHRVGVPVIPGTFNPIDVRDAPSIAEELEYPVIIKPAGGGGGIGIQVVWSEKDLLKAINTAAQLAGKTFGQLEIYLEKYLPKARHIEVQIIGTNKGFVYHLYERECSVQRRFQKVIEEAPSPALNTELRKKLLDLALKAAKACSYENAGTFEFLYDPTTQDFYLLEVNSRLQVEHPVTEMVTGVDIVREQILVAAGENPTFKQNEINIKGHAIEARVYAEDPLAYFTPFAGQLTKYREPSGPYVRVDSGYYAGAHVPIYYDPLIMKVICWGLTRDEARRRLITALEETIIEGVKTNIAFMHLLLNDPAFMRGDYDTRIVEERGIIEKLKEYSYTQLRLATLNLRREVMTVSAQIDAWKLASRLFP